MIAPRKKKRRSHDKKNRAKKERSKSMFDVCSISYDLVSLIYRLIDIACCCIDERAIMQKLRMWRRNIMMKVGNEAFPFLENVQ